VRVAFTGVGHWHLPLYLEPLAGIPGTLCAPFQRDAWLRTLAPHLDHAEPRVTGRARAELFGSRRMAERVACAYRDLLV